MSLGAAGTVTVGNQQIVGTAGGPVINTPTGLVEDHQVNGVSQLQVGLGGIIAFGSGTGTVNNAAVQAISPSTGNLSFNVPTGGSYAFRTNGVAGIQVSPCALTIGRPAPAESESCGAVAEYEVSAYCGVVVPMPTLPAFVPPPGMYM